MQLEAKIKFLKKVNNFSDIIKVNSKNFSNDIFIYDGNVNISYKTFDLLLDKCCHFFQESNISSKDVLSVVLENSLDFLIIYFASIRFGSIVNPIPLTSGVDGIKSIPPEQRLNLLTDLRLDGNAAPIKRVYIPKGKNEKRPLGIPIIQDRIKQALVKLVLEPEWEAKFEPNSYGFRPGRSCHDAVEAIFIAINQKPKYVLDADIKGCFDNIDHQFLLTKLNTFPEMEMQIKSWLKAGVMKDISLTISKKGVPQGGTISPLLMNIVLQGLETEIIDFMRNLKLIDENKRSLIKRRRPSSINTIVYADDFVVLNENLQVIEQTKEFIKEFLWKRGLKLNENKTRICHTLYGNFPGFDFLGFNIRQYEIGKYRVRKTKTALKFRTLIRPSKDEIKKHYENVKSIIDRTKNTEVLLMELNPKIIDKWQGNNDGSANSKTN